MPPLPMPETTRLVVEAVAKVPVPLAVRLVKVWSWLQLLAVVVPKASEIVLAVFKSG